MQFRYLILLLIASLATLKPSIANDGAPAPNATQGSRKISALRLSSPAGPALLFLGTVHTNDAQDPQIDDMEEQFTAFRPTVVLVEGGKWPLPERRNEAVSRYGEMAYAYLLAKNMGLAAQDADPEFGEEMRHVLTLHDAEMVKLYYVLRMVRQFRSSSDPTPLTEKVDKWLRAPAFDAAPPLNSTLVTLADFESACARRLPRLKDWKEMAFDARAVADSDLSALVQVADASSAFRDQHITNLIVQHMRGGQRVLVVAGQAHMDAQRRLLLPALRKTAPRGS